MFGSHNSWVLVLVFSFFYMSCCTFTTEKHHVLIQVWSIAFVLSDHFKLFEEKEEIRRWCLVPCWIFGFVRSQVATVSPVPYWITTASQPPVTDSGTAGSSENHRLQCSVQMAQPQSTLSQLLTMMFCTSTVAPDQRELLVNLYLFVYLYFLVPFSAQCDAWSMGFCGRAKWSPLGCHLPASGPAITAIKGNSLLKEAIRQLRGGDNNP